MNSRIHSLPRLPVHSQFVPSIHRQHPRLQFPQRGDQLYYDNYGKKLFQVKNQSVIDTYLKSWQNRNESQVMQKRMRKPVQMQKPRVLPQIDLMPTQPKKINKNGQEGSIQIIRKERRILNKNNKKSNADTAKKEVPSDILDRLIQSKSLNRKQSNGVKKLKSKEPKDQIIIKDFRQKIDPNGVNPEMQANRSNLYAIFQPTQPLNHKIQGSLSPTPISNKYQVRQNSKRSEPTSHNSYSQSPSIQSYKSNSYLRLFGSPENYYDQFSKYRYDQAAQYANKIIYKDYDLKNGIQSMQIGGDSNILRRRNPSNLVTLSHI